MPTDSHNKIIEEIITFKHELKNLIEALEVRLILKIETINNKVKELEKENHQLKTSLELVDRVTRKNNLIIFGMGSDRKDTIPSVCQKLNQLLDINLAEVEFNDVYSLGNKKESPIKIELVNYQAKRHILNNCKKLKGSNIIVTQDLTPYQREENKVLRKHLLKARENKIENCYIRKNKLYINNRGYNVEQLEISEEELENDNQQPRHSSAPETPITQGVNDLNLYANPKKTGDDNINSKEIYAADYIKQDLQGQGNSKTSSANKIDKGAVGRDRLRLRSNKY